MDQQETITALATPEGKSALAIIRTSGQKAITITAQCLFNRQSFLLRAPGTIGLYTFINPATTETIDQITAIKYLGPKSYTGEDMTEIICHGGKAVIEGILSALLESGARYAQHGEFTRRAFLNGKLSLLKAESIQSIIESTNKKQLSSAQRGYSGEYEEVFKKMRNDIKTISAVLEAEIEFSEEKSVQETKATTKVFKKLKKTRKEIEEELEKREKWQRVEKGIDIVIIGEPNTGKSSLFNALIKNERSLVHPQKGTTRDYITETCLLNGMSVTIADTAGIRKTKNEIEKMGVEKTWRKTENAHAILWVTSAEKSVTKQEKKIVESNRDKIPIISIINKIDLKDPVLKKRYCQKVKIPGIVCCLLKEEDKKAVREFILKSIQDLFGDCVRENIILNKRQENGLKRIVETLKKIETHKKSSEEIQIFLLKEALKILNEFISIPTNDEILDKIFGTFCIGK